MSIELKVLIKRQYTLARRVELNIEPPSSHSLNLLIQMSLSDKKVTQYLWISD